MRSDNGEVRHANFTATLLDETHAGKTALVTGKECACLVKMPAIDLVDNFQMPRQHVLEPLYRPFFERFGEQRVVRIGQRPLSYVPGLIPAHVYIIKQDPHEFRNSH